jgi:hypothetical protein
MIRVAAAKAIARSLFLSWSRLRIGRTIPAPRAAVHVEACGWPRKPDLCPDLGRRAAISGAS